MPWPVVTLLARKPATRPTNSQTRIDSMVRLMAIAASTILATSRVLLEKK